MATLERVMQMKEEGISNPNIIQTLRQEGISPKEIDEALSQSEIKSALGREENNMEGEQLEQNNAGNYEEEGYARPSYEESAEEGNVVEVGGQGEPMTQEYYPEYNAQGGQGGYGEYQGGQGVDIETINEIVEQGIEEKTDALKKQIASFTKFKEDTEITLGQMDTRLKRIENTIDELQISILRKMGEHGKNIDSIAREMHTTQDTFSKIIDPLTDSIRELKELSEGIKPKINENKIDNKIIQKTKEEMPRTEEEKPEERRGKQRPDFENFLR